MGAGDEDEEEEEEEAGSSFSLILSSFAKMSAWSDPCSQKKKKKLSV